MTDDRALSGNKKRKMRSASRLYAVQALFQMEHSGQTTESVRIEFLNHRFGADYDGTKYEEGNADLFTRTVDDAVNHQAQIDQLTDRALVAKWPLGRIDPTMRALFRAAGAELIQTTTPPKVIIVEYVDVASAFFPDGKEPKFVNAVLDHMAHEVRANEF
jgi:N utilization substance protein B